MDREGISTYTATIGASATETTDACSRSRPPHLDFFLVLDVEGIFSPPKPSQSFPSAVPAAMIPFDAILNDMMKGGDIAICPSCADRLAEKSKNR